MLYTIQVYSVYLKEAMRANKISDARALKVIEEAIELLAKAGE